MDTKQTTSTTPATLDPKRCRQARLARDSRYDGVFFVAVRTTGIFCRPICPAVAPKEKNVHYYPEASLAMQAGYRPCLRCRPDSAPQSSAWKGTLTTVQRGVKLIEQGALQNGTLNQLAERLGIGERYLRKLFEQELGLSPKAYALYRQVMLAKQLLHDSQLSITEIATASGFNSLRRFNDAFQKQMHIAPSDIRRKVAGKSQGIVLTLAYRPPFNWAAMLAYWSQRVIEGVEWVDGQRYGRSFDFDSEHGPRVRGHFELQAIPNRHALALEISLDQPARLMAIVAHIRRLMDLDCDCQSIEKHLSAQLGKSLSLTNGLRIPGIWSPFEAGIRAILGQQISIAAARTHLQRLTKELGDYDSRSDLYFFPSPEKMAADELQVLKMP